MLEMGFIRSVVAALLLLVPQLGLAQKWAVSTNLADYALLATMNADASFAVAKNLSVGLGVDYNPFTWGNDDARFQIKKLEAELSARWWPWHVYSGWWVSASARYRMYNYGGIGGPETEEGDAAGAALGAGYSLMLTKHINVDFGVGFWGGYKWYRRYACPRCGTLLEEGSRPFIMPDNLVVALNFVF